jgi:hypothetical protein
MNCEDIRRVLDDGDPGRWKASEGKRAEAHLASCPDCARDWATHERMLTQPLPPLPQDFARRCRDAARSVPTVASPRHAPQRTLVIGALWLTGAAVAGLIALDIADTLAIGPMAHGSSDGDIRSFAEAVHARLPEALDAIQGLELVAFPDSGPAPAASCSLTGFSALPPAVDISGASTLVTPWRQDDAAIQTANGDSSGFLTSDADYELLLASAQCPAGPTRQAAHWSITVTVQHAHGSSAFEVGGPLSEPIDPGQVATRIVSVLSGSFFVDATQLAELQAPVMDTNLPIDRRIAALDVFSRTIRGRGIPGRLYEAAIAAAVDIAYYETDPVLRAEVWRLLSGLHSPFLNQRLADALLYDDSEWVRIAAVETLAERASDPTARTTLKYASETDPAPSVAMRARWAVLDDAGRREYAVATLLDSSLADELRLMPLAYGLAIGPYIGRTALEISPANDLRIPEAVAEILPGLDEGEMKLGLLVWLNEVDDPSLADVYIHSLGSSQEYIRRTATAARILDAVP